MKRILILSPHLDDAALNCSNHILDWRAKGDRIQLINTFTKFGIKSTYEEIVRKEEDRQVMRSLKLSAENWDFIDGKYRLFNQKLVYETDASLFSGDIAKQDQKIVEQLKKKLSQLTVYDRILTPLGVGKHADHLIIKKAALGIFPKAKINFYLDFPYALRLRSWSKSNLLEILNKNLSIKLMSSYKQKLLKMYESQYKLLFNSQPNYPEIVFFT